MKIKRLLLCICAGMLLFACEDNSSTVGLSIQPESDKVNIYDMTVNFTTSTEKIDSVYAKTINGFLGNYYDPTYGNIKAGYVAQFYPSVGIAYPDSVVDGKIDSVILQISYLSYFGDSLAPMEVSVYPVTKPLEKIYYTNANPEEFCDMSKPVAKYGYTARNLNVSDSLLQAMSYLHWITIPLPYELGQSYFEKVKAGQLKTVDEFLDFLPGYYIKSTFGTGSMLAVDGTEIRVFYTRKTQTANYDATSYDSTVYVSSYASFDVTKEVIQLNSFEHKNDDALLAPNDEKTYIKSPAGIVTKVTIPIKEIIDKMGKKKFNSVNLSLKALPADDWEYSLGFPGLGNIGSSYYAARLLLVEPDSVKSFFEGQQVANSITSYTATFNSTTYTYDFSNIANVVQNAIDKAPDKDLELYVIPVLSSWTYYTSGYSQYAYDYLTSYYLYPSGVALSKKDLKIRIIASQLEINE
jgi:hypothetical protein